MNGTNTRNIGIYDADINSQIMINGTSVKKKGQEPPEKTIVRDGITIFFAKGYANTKEAQEQLGIAFINAAQPDHYILIGVGYKDPIEVDIH